VEKDLPDPVQDDLAVDEGHVDGALHGGEIIDSIPARGIPGARNEKGTYRSGSSIARAFFGIFQAI